MRIILVDIINMQMIWCQTAWRQNKYGGRVRQSAWRLLKLCRHFTIWLL